MTGRAEKLRASMWVHARVPGRCERRPEHQIAVGDRMLLVRGIGWCCDECAEERAR